LTAALPPHRAGKRALGAPALQRVRDRRQSVLLGFLLALVFFAFHAPYLSASLEDLDSINFALGIGHFDVARHQPHPPGYPLFILTAKSLNGLVAPEARALSVVSILAGSLGALVICGMFARIAADRDWWREAALLAVTSPLYWLTAARPLSDTTGLTVALVAQALILGARTELTLWLAGFCAGLSVGFRSQAAWLTLPLLLFTATRSHSSLLAGVRALIAPFIAFTAGVLAWGIPLVMVTGGPLAYWRAVFGQGSEDLSGVRMLWTTPTVRQFFDALYFAFVAPWALWPVAAVVLTLSVVGVRWLMLNHRELLVTIGVAFGPYLVFDMVFQETVTVRYALPVVVPLALLAAVGGSSLAGKRWLVLAVGLAMFDAHVGGTSVAAYAREPAPAFQMLSDMGREARRLRRPPIVAMDRREDLDLRRPIRWVDDRNPGEARRLGLENRLPAPPQREWLELARYWNGGGKGPVWFVADPLRTDIDLVDHRQPSSYIWALPYPVLVSGVRPNEMRWFRLDRPEWYVGEGWALTPEAAGVSMADGKGLFAGPIEAWVHKSVLAGATLLIGGRKFDSSVQPRLSIAVDDRPAGAVSIDADSRIALADIAIRGDRFLEFTNLPAIAPLNEGPEYRKLTVRAVPPVRMAIEQFDISARRTLLGFGTGWHEPEYEPATGRRWRWLSDRGELEVRSGGGGRSVNGALETETTLHIEGESPRRYFSRPSRLVIRAGATVLVDRRFADDFSIDVPLAANLGDTLSLETDQVYVPANRWWSRSPDRRRLGLRIFTCELRPASSPGKGVSFQSVRP
jgi:hypothetical protein